MFKIFNPMSSMRHNPFSVTAFFRRSLVLAYACPEETLLPLVPPGLTLDTWRGFGFLALAMVQTERLRPSFLPAAFGRAFFLCGYRVFVRRGNRRGLYILRSLTDQPSMVRLGNLFTHYRYALCRAEVARQPGGILWSVRTRGGEADVEVFEREGAGVPALPPESPFDTVQEARRFAGPLPITFAYDARSRSLVSVRGVRGHWDPRPVEVDVRRNTIVPAGAVLANAFVLTDVPYRWLHGVRTSAEAA
jgi:uncharacterized protein YqjF (DUF2071 family)